MSRTSSFGVLHQTNIDNLAPRVDRRGEHRLHGPFKLEAWKHYDRIKRRAHPIIGRENCALTHRFLSAQTTPPS